MHSTIDPGIAGLLGATPHVVGVVRAGDVLPLPPRHLLHAGPPLRDPCRPPAVLMSSAVMICIHEGWAADAQGAQAMVAAGRLTWRSAQDMGVTTPLAALVSSGTPLFAVAPQADAAATNWSPVSTLQGIDSRMGCRDPGIFARLRVRDGALAEMFARRFRREPMALLPIADHALSKGDDLHSRTTAATECFAAALQGPGASSLVDAIRATPLFFLTLWMGACAAILRSAEQAEGGARLITRAGGNGEQFGIGVATRPGQWIAVDAGAPQGRRIDAGADTAASGAIGDSAVIDMLGLGAQALADAHEPLCALRDHLPPLHESRAGLLLSAGHPGLSGRRVGMVLDRILMRDTAPCVALAMLGGDGEAGFLGRGVYQPPMALFHKADACVPKRLPPAR